MKKFALYLLVCMGVFFSEPLYAQMLDDAETMTDEGYEELFDDMYGEELKKEASAEEAIYGEENSENNIEARDENISLEGAAQALAQHLDALKKQKQDKDNADLAPTTEEMPTLNGEIFIGISKGSFVLFQDVLGRTMCSFGVTVRSTLDKDIRMLALKLAFPLQDYAFIYRDIKANGVEEKFIRGIGDICYNLSEAPDIEINRCRIFGASEDECAKRIRWDDKMESPDLSKSPYL